MEYFFAGSAVERTRTIMPPRSSEKDKGHGTKPKYLRKRRGWENQCIPVAEPYLKAVIRLFFYNR
jgi:hypothetical protein